MPEDLSLEEREELLDIRRRKKELIDDIEVKKKKKKKGPLVFAFGSKSKLSSFVAVEKKSVSSARLSALPEETERESRRVGEVGTRLARQCGPWVAFTTPQTSSQL